MQAKCVVEKILKVHYSKLPEALPRGSIFDKAIFFWHKEVSDYLQSVWDRRNRKTYVVMDEHARSVGPTQLQSARSMALNASGEST